MSATHLRVVIRGKINDLYTLIKGLQLWQKWHCGIFLAMRTALIFWLIIFVQVQAQLTRASDGDSPKDFLKQPGDPIPSAKFNQILFREAMGVVKIALTFENGQQIFGTGTFLSAEGHLISNLHVLKPLRDNPKIKSTFTLKDGRVVTQATFLKCDEQPQIDLCLVKLDIRPHYWFRLQTKLPSPYTALYLVGNPVDKDFEMLAGRLFLKATNGRLRLEVSVPVRPGFSGGPIFNDEGKLVCLASDLRYSHTLVGTHWEPDPSTLQYYCIEASVISKYIRSKPISK